MTTDFRTAALVLAAGTLGVPASARGQSASDSTCRGVRLEGAVRKGQAFEAGVGDGLRLRLDPDTMPSNPPGWTIRVLGPVDPGHDFSAVATPPYRFWNPRYLDTGYGRDAERVVALDERRFRFVLSDADYLTASRALGVLLWPTGQSEADVDAAQTALDSTPTGSGVFRIVASTTSPATAERPGGGIETVRFTAALCLPEEPSFSH